MIGKTVSHYKIIDELGAGGMGIVYKAEDIKLNRTVALKFLPPELIRDPDAKNRFIREAQAASCLDHPNICIIHEINETDDCKLFIVMAYYEGQTLKEKISSGSIAIEEAIDIAIQIAQGIVRAHEDGIVHRDIKPANIIITDRGEVKILDFGLAKLAGQAQLTKDTSTLGTVAYMSPEQLQGKKVDQRTDIWSLGVVLYEMLIGKLPFTGVYEQAVMYEILNENLKLPENIESKLQDIVKKSLHKNPDERYISAEQFLHDLSSIRENYRITKPFHKFTKIKNIKSLLFIISSVVIVSLIAIFTNVLFFPISKLDESFKTMAVLPFLNLKSDPETDYLGDALAAEIIKDLAYLQNLNVLPFSAVRHPEDQADLNVEYILTGNYLKENNSIRLNVELMRSTDQQMIWNEPFEEAYENTFKLQDKVSDKVIKELSIQFAPEEQRRMRRDVASDPLAYEYYLKSFAYPTTVEGSSMAIKMLNKSIQIDSLFAPAYFELGYHTDRCAQFLLGHSEDYKKVEKYYLKSLSLNPEYIEAKTFLASLYTEIGKTDHAFKLTKQILDDYPNNAWAHFRLSYILRYTGLNEESIIEAEKALTLLPNNPRFRSIITTFFYAGNYQRALELVYLDKKNPVTMMYKGLIYLQLGEINNSILYFQQSIDLEPDPNKFSYIISNSYLNYLKGKKTDAKKLALLYVNEDPYDGEMLYIISCLFGFMGDKEYCVRFLSKAINKGFFNYPFILRDPFLDPVRHYPEFQEVLALVKERHEEFKQKYFPE